MSSGVSDQPKSLEESFRGAKNRALAAHFGEGISIGIEDGLYPNPLQDAHYFNISVSCLFDGVNFHFGTSSSFAYPIELTELVFSEGLDMAQALNNLDYTDNPKVGQEGGAIGILSKGKLMRTQYCQQGVFMAIVNWQSKL